jgi:hypothetical protein
MYVRPLVGLYQKLSHSANTLQTGHINLFTVRHDTGRLCHVMNGHRGPVSALSMEHDEKGYFSAGWDGGALVSHSLRPRQAKCMIVVLNFISNGI